MISILNKDTLDKKSFIKLILLILTLAFLVLLSNYNYLLFHFTIELATAIIGYFMLIIIVNTSKLSKNNDYIFLGIAYAFIGTIDLLHALTFKGMNIFPAASPNTATQLWIIARYTQSITLLLLFKFKGKSVKPSAIVAVYLGLVIYSLAVIKYSNLFPLCYIDDVGLTEFKIISEYIICIILLIAIYFLYKGKNNSGFIGSEYSYLLCSIAFTIISEVCFTSYIKVDGLGNMLGHFFKFLSFYFLYIPLIKKNLQEPYNNIFQSLNDSLQQVKKANEDLFYKNSELEDIKKTLEKNLNFYMNFLEILPISIIIINDRTIAYVNNGTKKLLKLENKEDLIGKNLLDIIDDEYKKFVEQRLLMLKKEKIAPPAEEKLICSDGSTVDVKVSTTSIWIDNTEYFLGVLKDITNYKKLKKIENDLKEKHEYDLVRNEFLSNISHELKTPINVIYSALQLEEIYFHREDYGNIIKNNKIIKQNCMRLLRMINNLIDITKIDSGFFSPVLNITNIVDNVENTVLSVAPYLEGRTTNIIFDTESETEYVNCDGDLLERIVLNLISNAIKYGKPGGSIYVAISNPSGKFVSLSVKDNGIGIPKDKLDAVFERFIRVDKSLTRNCEGSGLGLSIVKSLVELQNGTIEIISEENIGTEVIIKFPLVAVSEEVCATLYTPTDTSNIFKKVDLEFSDIYDL